MSSSACSSSACIQSIPGVFLFLSFLIASLTVCLDGGSKLFSRVPPLVVCLPQVMSNPGLVPSRNVLSIFLVSPADWR